MNNRIISLRRHAKTDKSGKEVDSQQRVVSPEGKALAYGLGNRLKSENIVGAYTSPPLRSQQTLVYLMDGARQLDLEKMFVEEPLNEPVISSEYRKIINADGRGRDERIAFYLENQDPTRQSTTPYRAACGVSFFIMRTDKVYSSDCGRIEAITNAPKLESFLQTVDEKSFVEYLGNKSFAHLEGIELKSYNGLYIVRFRDKEIQILKSKVIELANAYTKWNG